MFCDLSYDCHLLSTIISGISDSTVHGSGRACRRYILPYRPNPPGKLTSLSPVKSVTSFYSRGKFTVSYVVPSALTSHPWVA